MNGASHVTIILLKNSDHLEYRYTLFHAPLRTIIRRMKMNTCTYAYVSDGDELYEWTFYC